jgi:hypothetical protein
MTHVSDELAPAYVEAVEDVRPINTDLSIFRTVLVGEEFSTVLGPLLDLGSLITFACVSKRVCEKFEKHILSILKGENAASRILRVCVRELHCRRGLDPRPPREFWFEMNHMTVPNSERLLNFNPATYLGFYTEIPYRARPTTTYTSQTTIRASPTERSIIVTQWGCEHLVPHMRVFPFGPDAEIPAYEGKGARDDPQVRTEWDYEHGVVLALNDHQWVGQLSNVGNHCFRQFRFHKTPNGVQHALILAGDLIHSACDFVPRFELGAPAPRLEVGDGGAA